MNPVYRYASLDSTNIEAKKLAVKGAVHGTAIIAEHQTAGRGRLGKKWCTVAGKGLYCSIIVRPAVKTEDYAKLTLVTGLAAARVLTEVSKTRAQLKWPNDVYFGGKKCAGILAESSPLHSDRDARYAILGIGVNVNQEIADFPQELQPTTTSLYEISGEMFSLEEIFNSLYDEVLELINLFEQDQFKKILNEWKGYDFLLGKEMECVDIDGNVVRGVSLGPDKHGALFVKSADGRLHEVLSGDVRLAGER